MIQKPKGTYDVNSELGRKILYVEDLLDLDKLPRKIECYDISNFAGEKIVAGMCVVENGVIKKELSKKLPIYMIPKIIKKMEQLLWKKKLFHRQNKMNTRLFF